MQNFSDLMQENIFKF